MNLFAKQKQRHRRREQTYRYQGGGGGGMNWEIGIDTYTLICIKQMTNTYTLLCIKQMTNENLPYSTGNSTQCSVVT